MKQNFTVRHGALDGVEAFLSVAQHRSFRRAATDLGVTPAAICLAIRTLESRIGAALFIRTPRSVGLTEAGERFLSRARPAFEELVAASGTAREPMTPGVLLYYPGHRQITITPKLRAFIDHAENHSRRGRLAPNLPRR